MQSPFQVFRRNQKTMMVVLTGLALFAFVLLDPLSQSSGQIPTTLLVVLLAGGLGGAAWIFGNQKGAGKDYALVGALFGVAIGLMIPRFTQAGPAVRTTAGSLSQPELAQLIRERQLANNFIGTAYARTNEDNMFAQPPYFTFFNHSGWGMEQDVVLGWLLNHEAEQQGIELSDEAVTEFITTFTNDKLSRDDFYQILRKELRVGEKELYDALRSQLRARMMRQMNGPRTVATPEQYWEYYKRLNVQVELDLTAIPVESFLSQVPEPSEEELSAFFQQHRENFENTVGPGVPGFRQPRRVRLAWLEADYTTIESQVDPVTDAEIEARYNSEKETRWKNRQDIPGGPGGLSIPGMTPPGSTPPAVTPPAGGSGPALVPPGGAPGTATPETPAKPPVDAEKPAADGEKPEGDKPESEKPAAEKPASEKPADDKPEPETPSESGDEGAAAFQKFRTQISLTSQVVFLQEEPEVDGVPGTEQPAAAGDRPPVEAPRPGTEPAEGADDAPVTPPAVEIPEYRPLSEVRDQIRDEILRERTLKLMREKIDTVELEMRKLGDDYAGIQEGQPGRPTPEQMDQKLRELAEQHGLVYGSSPLLSARELQESEEYPIGKASEPVDNPFSQQNARSVIEELFAGRLEGLYISAIAEDPLSKNLFAYWKIEDAPAHVPNLTDDGIREQVVRAWKMLQARPLAEKRAQELAEQVRQSNKPMPETLAEATVTGKSGDGSLQLTVQSTPPFSWMRSSTAASPQPFSRQPPQMSVVPGVDGAGEAFMETAFQKLGPGECGVAPNQERTIFYTMQVTQRIPDEAGMKAQRELFMSSRDQLFFMTPFGGSPVAFLAQGPQQEAIARWTRNLMEERYQVQFLEGSQSANPGQ